MKIRISIPSTATVWAPSFWLGFRYSSFYKTEICKRITHTPERDSWTDFSASLSMPNFFLEKSLKRSSQCSPILFLIPSGIRTFLLNSLRQMPSFSLNMKGSKVPFLPLRSSTVEFSKRSPSSLVFHPRRSQFVSRLLYRLHFELFALSSALATVFYNECAKLGLGFNAEKS